MSSFFQIGQNLIILCVLFILPRGILSGVPAAVDENIAVISAVLANTVFFSSVTLVRAAPVLSG